LKKSAKHKRLIFSKPENQMKKSEISIEYQ
jgi:hypothetical protein